MSKLDFMGSNFKWMQCALGLHDWSHDTDDYQKAMDAKLDGLTYKEVIRTCSCCQKPQWLELRCTSKHPPHCVAKWRNKPINAAK